jgi:hypothetical protein
MPHPDLNAKKPKRKRGAQPGNTNALKHGFYSRRFNKIETQDLEASNLDDLSGEIALLRVFTRRVFELAQDVDDLDRAVHLLSVFSRAVGKLSSAQRTRAFLRSLGHDETNQAIQQAITEVAMELSLDVGGG